MGQTTYFDEELIRLRALWMLAVQRRDSDGARDASRAHFDRAGELTAESGHPTGGRRSTETLTDS